jgi:hypothetical protein
VSVAQAQAIAAAFRDDLKRCRQALETCAGSAEAVQAILEGQIPMPRVEAVCWATWPGESLGTSAAQALLRYLEAGGRISLELAQDLARELGNPSRPAPTAANADRA